MASTVAISHPATRQHLSSLMIQALRQTMSDAHQEFLQAHLAYERALSIAADSFDSTDIIPLQQAGRKYAEAVVRHSNVVMEWLALVERSR
jgi:hypothetical protein